MNYNIFILKNSQAALMENEILFSVASARAQGNELLKLDIEVQAQEKAEQCAVRILRSLKKQGKIQFFVASSEISGASTEARYLRNKYPSLSGLADEKKSFIVKL